MRRPNNSIIRTEPTTETVAALWYAGSTLENMTSLMNNVTEVMTTYIREEQSRFSDPVVGKVRYNSVCIVVRWGWVAYSCATVALTLLFFIWIILQARRDQGLLRKREAAGRALAPAHDFKSGALPLLFHGLDEQMQRKLADIGCSNREGELADRSKEIMIRLVATDQGWKLSSG